MPIRPPRTCKSPGCLGQTAEDSQGTGLCPRHASERQERRAARDVSARKQWQAKLDQDRGSAYARGYDKRWQRFRKDFLSRNPLCAECARQGRVTAASVVDHIIPHRGDRETFWKSGNHQPLCVGCHTVKTLIEAKTAPAWAGKPDAIDTIDLV